MKKPKYYFVWIEGLSAKYGEKIKTLDHNNHTYTLRMGEALRVKRKDLDEVETLLKEQGVSNWCFESDRYWNTFIPISYAPKGTIYKTKYYK